MPSETWNCSYSGPIDAYYWENLPLTPFMSTFVAWLFMVLTGGLLVFLNERHMFINQRTMLPFFFYLLFTSVNVNVYTFSPAQLSNLLVILALGLLFSTYRRTTPVFETFAIGLLLSISSLLTVEYALLVVPFVIGSITLNSIGFRTFLAFLTGLICPVWMLFGSLYLYDADFLIQFAQSYRDSLSFSFVLLSYDYDFIDLIFFGSIIGISFWTLIGAMRRAAYDNVKSQRLYSVMRNFYLFCLVLFVFFSDKMPNLYSLTSVFASLIVAHYFTIMRGLLVRILFWFLLTSAVLYYLNAIIFQ